MYSRFYKQLIDNNILYKKQFGFQETEQGIIQFINKNNNSCESK